MLAEGESTRLARLPGIFLAALAAEARAHLTGGARGLLSAAAAARLGAEHAELDVGANGAPMLPAGRAVLHLLA